MKDLDDVLFFTLEKVVKSYRQFAHHNALEAGVHITIDQWLVLKAIQEHPEINQQQVAGRVYKDVASVTRIIELLVQKGMLVRSGHPEDRRRYTLTVSAAGLELLSLSRPVSKSNRKKALKGISGEEIRAVQQVMEKILLNIRSFKAEKR